VVLRVHSIVVLMGKEEREGHYFREYCIQFLLFSFLFRAPRQNQNAFMPGITQLPLRQPSLYNDHLFDLMILGKNQDAVG
jgi:hypothetical protein